ncbi:uncharacterized protein N7459_001848 [Penicillium hispanicum]|uniref:uncharacterized protein n=1 Tax=Penicillium hispanicum TaxID=1080232 RepID=UPI00254144B0|nr:uncharacterized protein N7459_001848 [Penicillium hispanicum]KAJ5591479.1 hypothetical protein N7459_001848 [Penicillium hispanicum]
MPSSARKGGPKGKGASGEKRQLVRWDPDLDIQLLLTVQWACNNSGVKIPWEKVATAMGEKFTEGAIVQHLSKLRLRREGDGKPVPPPLRRSVTAAANKASASKKESGKRKSRVQGSSDDEDEDNESGGMMLGDEDPDWGYSAHKKRHTPKRVKTSSAHTTPGSKAHQSKKTGSSRRVKIVDTSSSDSELLCAGAPFLQLFHDNESDSDSSRSDPPESSNESETVPKASKVVRLPVAREALRRLQSTGSVTQSNSVERDFTDTASTNPMFSSPPAFWGMPPTRQPVQPHYPSSGPNPYQQPGDLSCIDPALLAPEQYPTMGGWTSIPEYGSQMFAPPLPLPHHQQLARLGYPPVPETIPRWGPMPTTNWPYSSRSGSFEGGSQGADQSGGRDSYQDDLQNAFHQDYSVYQGEQHHKEFLGEN